MAEVKTDRELIREYAQNGSEGAFASLVQRHLDLVFATACRGVKDERVAQEVAQNVFITLARKAGWLGGETSLAGWLHKTALLEIRQHWRGELRRQRREQTAVELGTLMKDDDSLLKSLSSELDEGLLQLREGDRQALMLRYFEGRSHREIGALLGAREDAVRMRIDKALERLTRFFRRRGYAVPAVSTTVSVLDAAAKAPPAGLAAAATKSALIVGGGAAAGGLHLFLVKLMALTKTQTAILCLALASGPVIWEWHANSVSRTEAASVHSRSMALQQQEGQVSADLERLRADSARLDASLTDAEANRARYEKAAEKLEAMKERVRGLLTDANYRWPEDLPYARVSKETVKALKLLDTWPGTFSSAGKLTAPAQELLGITPEEKAPVEQALGNYWNGVENLMTTSAYETNSSTTPTGRLTKTVVVPALGQPLKDLGAQTRSQLVDVLGADREQMLFGRWEEGGVEIFWPGNLWNISEQPQIFSAWIDPNAADGSSHSGVGWHLSDTGMGMSTDSKTGESFSAFPRGIVTRFFAPWLNQNGLTAPTSFYGDAND